MSTYLKAAGHGWAAKTPLQEQEGERGRQGLSKSAKQLIIGSYYGGIVSARREVGFQSLLKTLMVQNRPHYRDIISIHTLTEPLGFLLGKIRFLHLRTSSLGAWLTERCSQLRAHPPSTVQLRGYRSGIIQLSHDMHWLLVRDTDTLNCSKCLQKTERKEALEMEVCVFKLLVETLWWIETTNPSVDGFLILHRSIDR